MKLFLKKYRIHILITVLVFVTTILTNWWDNNSFESVSRFYSDPEFRAYWHGEGVYNPIFLLLQPFSGYRMMDEAIIWGTVFFIMIIPFPSAIAGVLFYRRHTTLNRFKYFRRKRYLPFVLEEAMKAALGIALAIFAGYLLYYLLVMATGVVPSPEGYSVLPREIFLEWLGRDFYFTHHRLYWLLEGALRFFVVPFIYGMMACLFSLIFSSGRLGYLASVGYYTVVSIMMVLLAQISPLGDIHRYLDPSVIMASGSYYLMTLPLLLGMLFHPALVGGIFYANRKVIYDEKKR